MSDGFISIGDCLSQIVSDMQEQFRADAARKRAHRATGCNKRPCAECGVECCKRCGCVMSQVLFGDDENHRIGAAVASDGYCRACYEIRVREISMAPIRRDIPARFRDARFDADGFGQRIAGGTGDVHINMAMGAINEKSVIVAGGSQKGKTSLVAAMFNQLINEYVSLGRWEYHVSSPLFTSAFDLADSSEQQYSGGDGQLVRRAIDASLLVIDDLGSEIVTTRSPIARIMYKRHNDNKRTWVTTGLQPKEISAKYGDGIWARLGCGVRIGFK